VQKRPAEQFAGVNPSSSQPAGFSPDNSRLISLSDGVFAFALTLLVINLKVPEAATVAHLGLARAVLAQSRDFATWLLSFYVIGLYWLAHHRIFQALHGHDRWLLWLNLLFLLCISFIWYPTAVLGTHGGEQFAVIFYDAGLMLTSLAAFALWRYAARHAELLDPDTAQAMRGEVWQRTYGTIGVGVLSVAVSFVSVPAAELCWLLLALHRVAIGRGRGDRRELH
jgi:uncharacterized membrane protein